MAHALQANHLVTVDCGVKSWPGDDGWMRNTDDGHRTVTCSCGLTMAGPREQVEPLVRLHLEG